jgi:trans-aconitate 2-methyltransferase
MAVWDVARYEGRHSFVWRQAQDLVELLSPQPGERVLDLGCGTGHLTARIAARGAWVIGMDASPAMVEQARRNYPDLHFLVGDARDFRFSEPFDAVFSNAVLHWIKEQERAVACIVEALRPGGRLVAELGAKGNVASIVTALQETLGERGLPLPPGGSPWYFPGLGEYVALLERMGLEVVLAHLFDRPTPLEGGEEGLRQWLAMFAGDFLAPLPEARRDEVVQAVEERLRPRLFRDGTWVADYRRLRVVAYRR